MSDEFTTVFPPYYEGAEMSRGTAGWENPPYYLTAYGLAVKRGYEGTEEEWLASLKGEPGPGIVVLGHYDTLAELEEAVTAPEDGDMYDVGSGADQLIYYWSEAQEGWKALNVHGPQGEQGPAGADGSDGVDGADGASAYEQAAEAGYTGTEQEFMALLAELPGYTEQARLWAVAAGDEATLAEGYAIAASGYKDDAAASAASAAGAVQAAASDSAPSMDGTAAAGVSTSWARGDHVHPSDTGRAAFALGNNFGVCSTAAGTAAKTVTIPGITELVDGLSIRVLFDNMVSENGPTLNVNNLGAVSIKASKTGAIQTPTILGGSAYDFVYYATGPTWILLNSRRASAGQWGITLLTDSVNSNGGFYAASDKAVKTAYDAATTNLAPVEASSTSSANHAQGSFLVMNGVLYEVTSAIASGETITPGTNVTAVTVTGITDALDTRVTALETAMNGLVARLGAI